MSRARCQCHGHGAGATAAFVPMEPAALVPRIPSSRSRPPTAHLPAMLRIHPVALAIAVFAVASAARTQTFFVPPTDPAGNPTTPQKALLGKALFWDEQLSASRPVACGTCHVFGHGGGDPRSANVTHPGPDGVFGTADDIHGSPGVVLQD